MPYDQDLQGINYIWFKCGHGIQETFFEKVAFETKPSLKEHLANHMTAKKIGTTQKVQGSSGTIKQLSQSIKIEVDDVEEGFQYCVQDFELWSKEVSALESYRTLRKP